MLVRRGKIEHDVMARRFTLHNPYRPGGSNQYQGQLHVHSNGSPDSADTPTHVVEAYRDAGYDFITLTDHDNVTADPSVSGITWLGTSIEEFYNGNTSHIIAINTTVNSSNEVLQDVIDDQRAENALVMLCHPNLGIALGATSESLLQLERFQLLEVYNAFNDSAENDNGEDVWDEMLSLGKKIWGTAVDDCHDVDTASEFDDAWVQVFANDDSASTLLTQLERGNFYASTGASVTGVTVTDLTITITVPDSSNIEFIGKRGRVLQTNSATTSASYTITGDEMYVRIRVTKVSDSTMAWTQPIFLEYADNQELTGELAVARQSGDFYDNALINGNFDIWQRGTSFSTSAQYNADRWWLSHNATTANVSRQTQGDQYGQYCARLTLTTKGGGFTDFAMIQPLETRDSYSLRGKTVVFSMMMRRNSTFNAGNARINIYQGTGTDEPAVATGRIDRFRDISYDELYTDKWVQVWVRAFIETDSNQVGVVIRINDTNVPNGSYIEVRQVQLHVGSYPKLYQPRSHHDEYLKCLRYYWRFKNGSSSGTMRTVQSTVSTASVIKIQMPFMVPMRKSVAANFGGTRGTDWRLEPHDASGANATGTISSETGAEDWGVIRFDSGTYTAGVGYCINLLTSSGYVEWNAEL